MPMAFVHRPAVVRGRFIISPDATIEALREANTPPSNPGQDTPTIAARLRKRLRNFFARSHQDNEIAYISANLLERMPRIVENTEIERRYWTQPMSAVTATETFEQRNNPAVEDMLDIGEEAIRGALANANCSASQISSIVVSHSTTPRTPGPAQHWITRLGLPRNTWIHPMTELGCLGGVHSIAVSAQLVAGKPGKKSLVVCSECLHTVWRGRASNAGHFVHDALYGDLAASCVVEGLADTASKEIDALGLVVDECWTQTIPGTTGKYELTTGAAGQRFDSDRDSPKMVNAIIEPMLRELVRGRPFDVVLAHPGSSAILAKIERQLGCSSDQIADSWACYRDGGNQGGGTVIAALMRHLESAPVDKAKVVMTGVGPGFSGTGIWGWLSVPTHGKVI